MELSVKHVAFGYRGHPVLEDVSFLAAGGSLACLLGKNGAGKSTLFRCILGLLKGYRGSIQADGEDVRQMGERKLAARIAYIPQNHSSAFPLSVMDMVLMGTTPSFSSLRGPGREQEKRARAALETMKIGHLAHRSYSRISGGEQQLALIARAIAQQAEILVMDEPCANLDYGNQIRVMEELKRLAGKGYLILQSTHSPDQAMLFADQAIVLQDGTIAAAGPPGEVLTEELLEAVYQVPVRLVTIGGGAEKICVPLPGERKEL